MDALRELKGLVTGLPSAGRLLAALQGLQPAGADIAGLLVEVIKEYGGRVAPAPGGEASRASLADALTVIPQLAFLAPRGKQDLGFFKQHLLIKTAKADVAVPYAAIEHIAILDQIPKDTKGRVLLYLHLSKDSKVMNGKSALRAVVIQVTASQQLSMAHPSAAGHVIDGIAAVVLCQAFGIVGLPPTVFCSPHADIFTSSDGAAGVEAFVKARQGFLYPLQAGLCFLESPSVFIPTATIRSVELARANGASSTFDLYVHCSDGATHEFSNISRLEVGPIQAFIQAAGLRTGPADGSDSEGSGVAGATSNEGASESDDPEDEDFNPDGGSSGDDAQPGSNAAGSKKKRKRVEAQLAPAGEAGAKDGDLEAEEQEEEDGSSADSGCESDSESDDDDSDDSGSVEMVSEDEFSMGQLRSMISTEEGEQGKRTKGQPGGQGREAP